MVHTWHRAEESRLRGWADHPKVAFDEVCDLAGNGGMILVMD